MPSRSSKASAPAAATASGKPGEQRTQHQQHNSTSNLASPKPNRPVQSILVSPGTSAFPSAATSRRSSSASATARPMSGKCVHFPCAPDKLNSVAYTHSRELYDRSPILPSTIDLDIPSCRSNEEQGWIQCLQRKVKEAADEGRPLPHIKCERPESAPTLGGLTPGMSYDSGTSSSDSEELFTPLSISPPMTMSSPMTLSNSHMDYRNGDKWEKAGSSAMVDCGDAEEEGDSDASSEDECDMRKPGMCSLGKFSRSSLFECDALGGCQSLFQSRLWSQMIELTYFFSLIIECSHTICV